MAKHAAVPKFGQWDNGNTGFTTRFEVARQGRGGGGGGGGGQKFANPYDVYSDNEKPNTSVPTKAAKEPKTRWKEDLSHVHMDASRQNPNPQGARNDDAVRPSENRRRRSTGRFAAEGSQAPPGRPQQQAGPKIGNPRQTAAQHKGPSVPKFGAWDEINSMAGNGYTMQFDKLKKEREAGAHNKLPPISPQSESTPQGSSHGSSSGGNPSLLSKVFRCLNP